MELETPVSVSAPHTVAVRTPKHVRHCNAKGAGFQSLNYCNSVFSRHNLTEAFEAFLSLSLSLYPNYFALFPLSVLFIYLFIFPCSYVELLVELLAQNTETCFFLSKGTAVAVVSAEVLRQRGKYLEAL